MREGSKPMAAFLLGPVPQPPRSWRQKDRRVCPFSNQEERGKLLSSLNIETRLFVKETQSSSRGRWGSQGLACSCAWSVQEAPMLAAISWDTLLCGKKTSVCTRKKSQQDREASPYFSKGLKWLHLALFVTHSSLH